MRDLRIARLIFAAAGVATILSTWNLWQERTFPPLLPAFAVPHANLGAALILTLVSSVVWPRTGVSAFALVAFYAMLRDQTPVQPEMISLTILMVSTLAGKTAQLVGRVHLISLWGWAGLNKLLSPTFLTSAGPLVVLSAWPSVPPSLALAGSWTLALLEISIGLLAAFSRTRRLAAYLGVSLHVGILLVLLSASTSNAAVIPWNIALSTAALALIKPWTESLQQTFVTSPVGARLIAAVLVIGPAGFYIGMVDAYPAHNLYAANGVTASIAPPTMRLLRVPFPPDRRLFIQYFQSTCHEGQQLHIVEGRTWFSHDDVAPATIPCEFHVARLR
jgi:hypothetical protein